MKNFFHFSEKIFKNTKNRYKRQETHLREIILVVPEYVVTPIQMSEKESLKRRRF